MKQHAVANFSLSTFAAFQITPVLSLPLKNKHIAPKKNKHKMKVEQCPEINWFQH